jgi:hypothetical protein
MGGRYLITGTQIGIIKALVRTPDALNELNKVLENQFVYDSEKSIEVDISIIRNKIDDNDKPSFKNYERIEHCLNFMEWDNLTEYQHNLIESFETQFRSKGTLTEKQIEILEDIFKKAAEK